MRRLVKCLAIFTMVAAVMITASACGRHKKAAKPKVKTTAEVKNGTTTAGGKGSASSEVPLRVGCGHFDKKFNPFMAESEADRQAVELTQVMLLDNDRTGRIVEQGIDGEQRKYNGKEETYFGIADVKVRYKKKEGYTVYRITLRDDLLFSDGEPITIDDVIFTLYAFCDKDYAGSSPLKKSAIQGLKRYQKKKADTISGIQRLNDYELRIYTDGFDQKMLDKLRIPVCALHYYGDTTKYQYEAGQFGFTRGDLSALRANKNSPMGAGPYRFVKYENGIAYFMANELYFQECPETAYLYMEDLTQLVSDGNPTGTALVSEITGDTVDMVLTAAGQQDLETVMAANENGKIDGKTLETRFVTSDSYGYVCMNAEQIKVGTDGGSDASIALRRALATVISACRGSGQDEPEQLMSLLNTPVSVDSWLSPKQYGEDEIAFAKNLTGETLYQADDDSETKRIKAKEAALEYLQAAGYMVADGRITLAPSGGMTEFNVWIQGGEQNPLYGMLTVAAEDFQELGIVLNLNQVMDAETMEQQLQTGTQQIWCGLDSLGIDPKLTNHYSRMQKDVLNKAALTGISDERLEKKLEKAGQRVKAENRIKTTDSIYEILSEWAVEIPVYQSKQVWLMSSDRVNMDTISTEVTPYYSILREVHKIKMNKD
ncbi:MAG: hypothetical protein K2J67_10475 [Lachnospiraceae bacterium]|nr:hypothetical protein [Lachnospiraceae bacterium]